MNVNASCAASHGDPWIYSQDSRKDKGCLHFYRTPAKFRAWKHSKDNHALCFRAEENWFMAWRRCFFPLGITPLGYNITNSSLWSSKTWALDTMKTAMGSWQTKRKNHIFGVFDGCFFLGLHREITQKVFWRALWVTPHLPHLWASEGCVPAELPTHLQKSF